MQHFNSSWKDTWFEVKYKRNYLWMQNRSFNNYYRTFVMIQKGFSLKNYIGAQ